jgi:hypothetical protein
MSKNFVPLWTLVSEWAEQSGEPFQVVLRNLSLQDELGRVPEGTFKHAGTGEIHGALRRLVECARPGGFDMVHNDAIEDLDRLFVSMAGILEYCAAHHVHPPKSLVEPWEWQFEGEASFESPPHYPVTSEDFALEQEREDKQRTDLEASYQGGYERDARNRLSILEIILDTLETRGDRSVKPLWSDLEAPWRSAMTEGIGFIDELSDEDLAKDLRKEFEDLDDRLASLGADAGGLDYPTKATIAAETKARKYLKEQVEAGNRLTKPEHFRRASEQIGETLSERAFERAWSQKAPKEWQKPGRPKMTSG